jgi:TetR/AcrR family transcriptional regulator, biofilm operon repressor
MSLQYRDEVVRESFMKIERTMMSAAAKRLARLGIVFKHEREQTYLLFTMIKGILDQLAF